VADGNRKFFEISIFDLSLRKVVATLIHWNSRLNLQLNRRRLAGRGLERHPRQRAGGPQGRLAEPRKNALMLYLFVSMKSSLQLNDL
jgi:hypothetical protein